MKTILLIFSFAIVFSLIGNTQESLKIGDKAPGFNAVADDGSTWSLSAHQGKKTIVVYFYPAAMTGGCTKQACAYRDAQADLEAAGVMVVGVSGDKPEGLQWFKKAENLNFTLLSDESGEIARMFGVPLRDGATINREIDGSSIDLVRGVTASRWTFIIDKKGNVVYKNEQVDAAKDAEAVLAFIKNN